MNAGKGYWGIWLREVQREEVVAWGEDRNMGK